MTKANNHSQAADLVARYLSGEMDAGEKLDFKHRLLSDQHLSNEFEAAKQAWDIMDYYSTGTHNQVDTDKAWDDLSSLIGDNEKTASYHPISNLSAVPFWLRWAAAILLAAGLGWIAYMQWSPSAGNSWLVLENADSQRVMVKTLHDGSVVYLAQESHISYPGTFDAMVRNVQIEGEAFFDVVRDASKPFTIQAGNATIEVLGTSFNVKTSNTGFLELFVETGRVKVLFGEGRNESVLVNQGQLLTLQNESVEMHEPTYYNTRWRENLLQFKDESLQNILKVLAKTYGYTFETEDENLDSRIMTLTLDDSSIETVSELIALSLSVEYEIEDNSRVIFRNPR